MNYYNWRGVQACFFLERGNSPCKISPEISSQKWSQSEWGHLFFPIIKSEEQLALFSAINGVHSLKIRKGRYSYVSVFLLILVIS